jgi:protein-arginine kinase activator protein McsA
VTAPVELSTCPDCAFTFDAVHTDNASGDYTCPACAEQRLTDVNERLRHIIRRLLGNAR